MGRKQIGGMRRPILASIAGASLAGCLASVSAEEFPEKAVSPEVRDTLRRNIMEADNSRIGVFDEARGRARRIVVVGINADGSVIPTAVVWSVAGSSYRAKRMAMDRCRSRIAQTPDAKCFVVFQNGAWVE